LAVATGAPEEEETASNPEEAEVEAECVVVELVRAELAMTGLAGTVAEGGNEERGLGNVGEADGILEGRAVTEGGWADDGC
jgi:hypothetical protein